MSQTLGELLKENPDFLDIEIEECSNKIFEKFIHLFMLALSAMIIFVILELPWISNFFRSIVKTDTQSMILKSLVMFFLIFIVDRYVEEFRLDNIVCV